MTLSRNLTGAWYVPKSNSSRNFEKSPFNRICRLTVYSLQRCQKHLTKFLKDVLKLTENFQEVVSNMVSYQKYTKIQAAAFSLACFKTPEMTSMAEFLSSEKGANDVSTE